MLDELVEWGKICGLNFNPAKTVVVHFTRRQKSAPYQLKVDGVEVDYSDSVKYLGVTIDKGLYWRQPVQEKVEKARSLTYMIMGATKANFGPCPKWTRWAYTGVVRPMIAYRAPIWAHELNTKRLGQPL